MRTWPQILTTVLSFLANILVIAAVLRLPAGEVFRRGSVNGDQTADISDAISVFAHLFLGGARPGCLDAADINDDGRVDITDGVFLLNHLFQGGSAPPAPAPGDACPGEDPTPDGLDCQTGQGSSTDRPSALLYPVIANAPGVRQRSRVRLPLASGGATYQVAEGTSFAILVEASSNRATRAGFALADPVDPMRGNPGTLRVRADRPLGDPAHGGAAAGEELAPWLYRDLDGWSNPIYLTETAGMRIAHDGSLTPAPGTYVFHATVTDELCASSEEASFTLEVLPSRVPEISAWIEGGAVPAGAPAAHDAGSGNARGMDPGFIVVVEGLPNGRAAGDSGAAPDPGTFEAAADPPIGLTGDVRALFTRDLSAPARFHARLEPEGAFPGVGNTLFTFTMGTGPGENLGRVQFILERAVSYPGHIQPIWDSECSGCHERPDLEEGLELVAPGIEPWRLWRNVVNVYAAEPALTSSAPLLVWPYYPERSYLYHKLAGTQADPAVEGEGDRMPKDATIYLPESQMHLIRSWILQGAGAE